MFNFKLSSIGRSIRRFLTGISIIFNLKSDLSAILKYLNVLIVGAWEHIDAFDWNKINGKIFMNLFFSF